MYCVIITFTFSIFQIIGKLKLELYDLELRTAKIGDARSRSEFAISEQAHIGISATIEIFIIVAQNGGIILVIPHFAFP